MPREAASAASSLVLDVRLGRPLGDDPVLIELAARRLWGADPRSGDVLLFVGRGSSFDTALRQAGEVARRISDRAGLPHVVCHAGISRPDSAEGMRTAAESWARRVLVLPWLIHNGVLLDRVRGTTEATAREHAVEVIQLPHIGNAPEVVGLIANRVKELL